MTSRLFGIAWRLAMLVLPWQTRWIVQSGSLGGFPWEQGTVAVYGSWVPLLVAVTLGFFVLGNSKFQIPNSKQVPISKSQIAAIALLVIVSLYSSNWLASGLWWLHVTILALFVWTLIRANVDVAPWFVLSLVPHAALGVWQFAAQDVTGSTLLGIATQHPWTSGVSVVEHGLYRVLRVYGGFPHPSILGGWLAVGLTLLPTLARRSRSNVETLALAACAALFATVLVLTFSRGAWIATVVGLSFAGWFAIRSSATGQDRQAAWLVLTASVVAIAAGLASQWDHVTARFTPQLRLEKWSIEQRSYALEEGLDALRQRPLVGWGPGASLVAITTTRQAKFSSRLTVPPEPPHVVPFAALVELGLVSTLALAYLAWRLLRDRWRTSLPLLSILVVLMMTDHYLWTLWAGQALAAIVFILIASRQHERD